MSSTWRGQQSVIAQISSFNLQKQKYKALLCPLASWKTFHGLQPGLSKTGKLRTCSKITRLHLGLAKDEGSFPGSLDFFASFFDQAKNEDNFFVKIETQN
jgi:hypothetical protein